MNTLFLDFTTGLHAEIIFMDRNNQLIWQKLSVVKGFLEVFRSNQGSISSPFRHSVHNSLIPQTCRKTHAECSTWQSNKAEHWILFVEHHNLSQKVNTTSFGRRIFWKKRTF